MRASLGEIWVRRLRDIIRLAFRLIIAVTAYYFARAVVAHWSNIAAWRPGILAVVVVIAMVPIYAASLFLLAELWHRLVRATQDGAFSRALTYPSYAITQIAKYLPGNVFQFIGRYVWLSRENAAQAGLVLASLLEVATMVASSSLIVAVGLALGFLPDLPGIEDMNSTHWLVAAGILGLGLTAMWIAGRKQGRVALPSVSVLAQGLGFAVTFFALQGLIFLILCRAVDPSAGIAVMTIATASWLIGYLTPGAPGGIGVREVVMLLLLRPVMPEVDALIAIALFRLVTTLGDLLCWLAGITLWRRPAAE